MGFISTTHSVECWILNLEAPGSIPAFLLQYEGLITIDTSSNVRIIHYHGKADFNIAGNYLKGYFEESSTT